MQIGSLYHAVQAEWASNPHIDPVEISKELANEEIDRVKKAYLQRIGAPMSPVEIEPMYDGIGLVIAMVDNYRKRWGQPLMDGFRLVGPEQTCVVPIPGTEHECDTCQGTGSVGISWEGPTPYTGQDACPNCSGKGTEQHYLAGTLDGLLQSGDGRYYVLERKTYGQRPRKDVLDMQDQFLAYLWILRELNIGPVGGLAYDGAWKRKEPPRGSTLEDLFIRTLLHRNRTELDRFTTQIAAVANEMANDPAIYINRRWDGCWDCDFVEPCVAQERGEDYKFILSTKYVKRDPGDDSTRELKLASVEA